MFQKATKSQSKLRAALYGPAGSGKTFSALGIASGMGGSIAVIDTEHGSAAKYSDRFSFDVCDLADKTIDGYIAAIREASSYSVLIIDSLSHGWQELLNQVDKLAQAKYRGNTWSAWSEGTPKQKALVEAILSFPGHIIATMRTDTEWVTEKDERSGKSRPVKVGLKPTQGKGIEYEFDLLIQITPEHIAFIEKDRTGKFQDKSIEKPGAEFGKALAAWLTEGESPVQKQEDQQKRPPHIAGLFNLFAEVLGSEDPMHPWIGTFEQSWVKKHPEVTSFDTLTIEQAAEVAKATKAWAAKKKQPTAA